MKTLKDWNIEHKTLITLNPYNTFVIIKPGFIKKHKQIIDCFLKEGYTISKYQAQRLTFDTAADLYSIHKDESFYEDLCKYMSSDYSIGYCLDYRGDKDVVELTNKIKDNIRKTFGKGDEMKNVIHSSDSLENVEKESKIYFKQI